MEQSGLRERQMSVVRRCPGLRSASSELPLAAEPEGASERWLAGLPRLRLLMPCLAPPGSARPRAAAHLFLVGEVAVGDHLQIVVEFVGTWQAGRDVELDDVVIRDLVQVLDQCAQAVAVGGDQDRLAALQVRDDDGWPSTASPARA